MIMNFLLDMAENKYDVGFNKFKKMYGELNWEYSKLWIKFVLIRWNILLKGIEYIKLRE